MVRAFSKVGFEFIRQKGSHIVLSRGEEILIVPNHSQIAKGTERDLIKLSHFEDTLPADYRFIRRMVLAGVKQILVTGTCFEYGLQKGVFQRRCRPFRLPSMGLRRIRFESPWKCSKQFIRLPSSG